MHGKPQAGIAQLVERNLAKVEVASSSLVSRSKRLHLNPAGIAQLVERNLAKVEVASSSLVSRSTSCKPFTPLKRLVYSFKAEWQSGYAAACKAVYAGSIPTSASTQSKQFPLMAGWQSVYAIRGATLIQAG